MADLWTQEDSALADSQGWNLFEASIDGKKAMLIERDDEKAIFDSDDKALTFVTEQAKKGCMTAAKALRMDTLLPTVTA